MDASKITELMQKRNNIFINRAQTVDSSTLIWKNRIESSKYIAKNNVIPTVTKCSLLQTTHEMMDVAVQDPDDEDVMMCKTSTSCYDTSTKQCFYGGSMKGTTIMTGSPQVFPNLFAGSAGSGSFVYSSDNIILQKVGINSCCTPGTAMGAPGSYIVLDPCYCVNTNAPVPVYIEENEITLNANRNPYLPYFDEYYALKNKTCVPCADQKHFVKKCHTRFLEKNGEKICSECTDSKYCEGCVQEKYINKDNLN